MKCFEQSKINFQKLRNQAYDIVESTRPNLGEKSTKEHIKAIILMWNMDLMLDRKTPKQFFHDVEELMRKQ